MNRIAVIGCGGAGKSTLSRKLGALLGIEVIHLDRHYWRKGWVASTDGEWRATHARLLDRPQWVMDGNFGRTMDERLGTADTVIYLDMPRWLCMVRVLGRWLRYWRRTRPDLPDGCPESLDMSFLRWVWTYRRTRRAAVLARLGRVGGACRVVVLSSHREVERFLGQVSEEVSRLPDSCPES